MCGADGNNPSWWNLKIITEWQEQKHAGTCFKTVLDANNVSWSKMTCMHSSSQGELQSDEIATMSKQQKDKIFVYLTDLLKPVLRVMSGHNKDARYYVPRMEIDLHKLGLSLDQALAIISPKLRHGVTNSSQQKVIKVRLL